MTLPEILISLTLLSLLVVATSQVMKTFFSSQAKSEKKFETNLKASQLNTYLKQRLGGTKNLQNTSLRLPGLAGKRSRGAGIYIEPETNFYGASSPGNDRLIAVVLDLPITQAKLTAPLPGVFGVASLNGESISDLFAVGDLVAISNIQNSELVFIAGGTGSGPLPVGSPTATIALKPGWNDYLFESNLTQKFKAGDYVYKVSLIQIGYDPTQKTVLEGAYGANSGKVIGNSIDSFSVGLNLASPGCDTVTTASDEYKYGSLNWDVLNTAESNLCYSKLNSIQVKFSVEGKIFSNVLITNN